MGDPAGVGPELCARLLVDEKVSEVCHPVVFGDKSTLLNVADRLDLVRPEPNHIIEASQLAAHKIAGPTFAHVGKFDVTLMEPGRVNEETGAASFEFIESAIAAALAGHVDAVATGPINKEAWQAAGIKFPGHTELFADRANSDRFCMMMTSPAFSCSLVTTHIGYGEVPSKLETDRILEVIHLTHEALERICGRKPKLVALGLNPHAGEGGLFGNQEEEKIIAPAIKRAIEQGIEIEGPIPPDTAFLPWRRDSTDGYICMYHDQGLIPFKAFNFDTGVNITLGLPIIRTSVDHGTALDIAWQGKADVSSFVSAVKLAARLARKK
jgi:4-hydroxythreonine-4-phosphate dehydrogenase